MDKFLVLKSISENEHITQRNIAKETSCSLGKVNILIKECIVEGLIAMDNNKYIITEKGYLLLEEKIKEVKSTQLILSNKITKKIKQAVILAAGKKEGLDMCPALLMLENESIIDRTVRILKNNDIEKIIIVVGYDIHKFNERFKDDDTVILVNNDRYKWTGSMKSLSLVNEYITDDFILIEGDLIYEEAAIEKVLNYQERDCVLITNESGSGDEGFVQLKDGYLFKLAKDIHQFNRIDGEMIGISKVSYRFYNTMLKEYQDNINDYVNYEYIMLDVSRDFKVPCYKYDDLVWCEVDKIEDYNKVLKSLLNTMKRKEKLTNESTVKNAICNALDIDPIKISQVIGAGGMTNKNYKVCIEGEYYITRMPGAGTEKFINRQNEILNSEMASKYGINVESLYFNADSGIKISKFIEDAETLTGRSAKKEENIRLICDLVSRLHNSNIEMKNKFDVYEEINKYEDICNKLNVEYYENYLETKKYVMNCKEVLEQNGAKYVPSHNDALPANFIKNKEGRMYLIDWEYSGVNEELWDLASMSIEAEFEEKEDELLLNYYFGRESNVNEKIKFIIHKINQDFLWSIWTLFKEKEGDDFGNYGINRYLRAIKNIKILDEMNVL